MRNDYLELRVEDLSSETWFFKNSSSLMTLLSKCCENKSAIKFDVRKDNFIKIEVLNNKIQDVVIEGVFSSICDSKKIVLANANNNLFLPFFTDFKSIIIPHNRFYTYGFKDKTLITFILRNIFSSLALKREINLIGSEDEINMAFSDVFKKYYYWHVKKYLLVNGKNVDIELVHANLYLDVIRIDHPLWEKDAQKIREISQDNSYLPSDSYIGQLVDLRRDIIQQCYS